MRGTYQFTNQDRDRIFFALRDLINQRPFDAVSLVGANVSLCDCQDALEELGFEDLIDKKKLRFDFAIFKGQVLHCLIEYQGSQHFINMGKSSWNSPQEHDKMKREYCEKNNIRLIEISYKDLEKIDWNYLKEKCDL